MLERVLPFLALAASASSQQAFEVASIKPNASGDNRIMIRMAPGGRFTATGITLKQLIAQAYGVRDSQVSGGPGWISADRFDIQAKGPDGMPDRVPPEVLRPMLRALVEERFQLETHKETKEMPVYALVPGKGGAKLTPSAAEGQPQMRMGRGQVSGKKVPMAMLAQQLAIVLGRNVIDKTGMKGDFDFTLEWTPEPGQGGPPPADSSGPTIFTAVQEQLGLKLEADKGPVDIIVIDSVSKPTEN